ncbi:hypothetical protein [Pendulispora albinea]|uniref:Uncharacterized protein n=1 Tax=Pendulispora albinea TaxID=2741071 RepID=A0ABZ2LZH1_9BACT
MKPKPAPTIAAVSQPQMGAVAKPKMMPNNAAMKGDKPNSLDIFGFLRARVAICAAPTRQLDSLSA